jgi:hypothetical protein
VCVCVCVCVMAEEVKGNSSFFSTVAT